MKTKKLSKNFNRTVSGNKVYFTLPVDANGTPNFTNPALDEKGNPIVRKFTRTARRSELA